MKSLSLVIINHNTAELLQQCLQSIESYAGKHYCEILVVDNASQDQSQEVAAQSALNVQWHPRPENTGFAAACNYGMRHSRGDAVWLLNSDVKLTAGATEQLLDFMQQHPQAALCAPQYVFAQGQLQNSIDHFPSPWELVFNKSFLRWIWPQRFPKAGRSNKRRNEQNTKQDIVQEAVVVPSVVGACMLVNRSAWKDLRGFDEDYFFYFEETDFCWRAWQQNWQVWFVPTVRVWHGLGRSARKQPLASRIEYHRSRMLFWHKRGYGSLAMGWIKCLLFLRCFVNTLGRVCHPRQWPRARVSWGVLLWYLRGCPRISGLARRPLHTQNVHLRAEDGQRLQGQKNELFSEVDLQTVLHFWDHPDEQLLLKNSQSRKVYRVKLPSGQEVVLKFYRSGRGLDSPKARIKGSLAQREWSALLACARQNLSVPEPLMYLDRCAWGGGVRSSVSVAAYVAAPLVQIQDLKTQTVSRQHVVDLLDFTHKASSASYANKRRCLKNLAQVLAHLHAWGVAHRDLHAANILLRSDPSHSFQSFCVVDWHRAFFREKIRSSDVLRDWAYLLGSAGHCLSQGLKMAVWQDYLQQCQLYRPLRSLQWKWFVQWQNIELYMRHRCSLPLEAACAPQLLSFKRAPFSDLSRKKNLLRAAQDSSCTQLKRTAKGAVLGYAIASKGAWVVKQVYRWTHWRFIAAEARNLKYLRQSLHSKTAWRVPWPVFAPTWDQPAALVLRWIRNTQNLDTALTQNSYTSTQKRAVLTLLATLFRDLHSMGIVHKDLKAANILLRWNDKRPQLYLLDCGRMRHMSHIAWKDRVLALQQLWSSLPLQWSWSELTVFGLVYCHHDRSLWSRMQHNLSDLMIVLEPDLQQYWKQEWARHKQESVLEMTHKHFEHAQPLHA